MLNLHRVPRALARTVSLVILAGTAAAWQPDAYEDNDTCATAAPLTAGFVTWLTLETADPDFFLVSVPANADVRVIALDAFMNPLDIDLYDASCALLASTTGAPLHYFACGAPAGNLVIGIPAAALVPTFTYTLDVQVSAVVDPNASNNATCATALPVSTFSTAGYVVTRCNEDWWFYRVLPNGYAVKIDLASSTSGIGVPHAPGAAENVDLELWDNGCSALLASSTSPGNTESVFYRNTGTSPMVVRARVSLAAGEHASYMLTLCFEGPPGSPVPPQIGTQVCEALSNSTGSPGTLCAVGYTGAFQALPPPLTQPLVRLGVFELPMNSFGYFIASQTTDFVQAPGTNIGNLCLGTPGRYAFAVLNPGSTSSVYFQVNPNAVPMAGGGFTAIQPGETWHWQYWHRDVVSGMPTSTFSSAIAIPF